MPKGFVNFFSEKIKFKVPFPRKTVSWIRASLKNERKSLAGLNFIFCNDNHLREINIQYLGHETYTDIITFDNAESSLALEGDIYISIDRVKDNANKYETSFEEELRRVMIHGVLHLIGYGDKTTKAKTTMRKKEAAYLSLWK